MQTSTSSSSEPSTPNVTLEEIEGLLAAPTPANSGAAPDASKLADSEALSKEMEELSKEATETPFGKKFLGYMNGGVGVSKETWEETLKRGDIEDVPLTFFDHKEIEIKYGTKKYKVPAFTFNDITLEFYPLDLYEAGYFRGYTKNVLDKTVMLLPSNSVYFGGAVNVNYKSINRDLPNFKLTKEDVGPIPYSKVHLLLLMANREIYLRNFVHSIGEELGLHHKPAWEFTNVKEVYSINLSKKFSHNISYKYLMNVLVSNFPTTMGKISFLGALEHVIPGTEIIFAIPASTKTKKSGIVEFVILILATQRDVEIKVVRSYSAWVEGLDKSLDLKALVPFSERSALTGKASDNPEAFISHIMKLTKDRRREILKHIKS